MLFWSVAFAVFLPVVFVGSWLLRPRPGAWKLFVLAASYVFYGWWSWRFLLLVVALTAVTVAAAPIVARAKVRLPLALASVVLLAPVVWYKLHGLGGPTTNGLSLPGSIAGYPLLAALVPLGLSFLAFQAITYLAATRRGHHRPLPVVDLALHLAFFPRLLAGPVVPPEELVPQLRHRADPREVAAVEGIGLVLLGLAKKVVVSAYLAKEVVNPVFGAPGKHGALDALLAIYGWTAQLYCDASGYVDVALGVALLLGVRLAPEFASPLTATSLTDFWGRWYRSLTGMFTSVAVGGERRGVPPAAAIVVAMAVYGLWHRPALTFLVWGGLHGAALALERVTPGGDGTMPRSPARLVVGWLITFNVVALAGVFFRSTTLHQAFSVLGRLLHGGAVTAAGPLVVVTIVAVVALQLTPPEARLAARTAFGRLPFVVQGVLVGVALFAIGALAPTPAAPYLYFQF